MARKRINPDCPFTAEDMDYFKAMLYMVNTSFHCVNAAPVSWAVGYQNFELRERETWQQLMSK